MAKRFTATEIWDEDWFLEMPMPYKMFWYYMLATCDHAGLFKVNLRSFCGLNEVKLTSGTALTLFNTGKQRIRVVSESVWFIEDFFVYQYGTTFNPNNRLHESIGKLYFRHKIELTSIRGLLDLKDGVKDKDKDKDKYNKGVFEKKERGIEFSDDKTEVVFPSGRKQKIGPIQKDLMDIGELKPIDVVYGLKN